MSTPGHGPQSIIGRGTRIEGSVQFSGALRIEGSVHGEIRGAQDAPNVLALGREATVVGSVAALDVSSEGHIEGSVSSAGVVALLEASTTRGELNYEKLQVERGAVVDCVLRPQHAAAE